MISTYLVGEIITLAGEIIESLEAALDQFRGVVAGLERQRIQKGHD